VNVLRWIVVLPASFICGVLAALIALAISGSMVPARIIMGLIAGGIFVWVGGLIAPTHKRETIIVLAMINSVYSLWQAKTLLLAPGKRVDWLSLSRALGGIVAVFCF
jgi:hypothetical protein